MELKQLEYFKEIAATGSINEAARRLNMSQPPLSYQIKQLEIELGVKLFERSHNGVALTEAGKLLYNRCTNLLDYAHSTKLEVSKTAKNRVLRLGITSTTVSTIVPVISSFVQKNPDINFEVHDGSTFSLYNYLMDGIIDVSVVRTPLRLDEVEYTILKTEPMIAASSFSASSCDAYNINLSALINCPLILYRRYEKLITDAFAAHNLQPDIFCICDDARDAMLWAKEGLATAIFPKSMEEQCIGLKTQCINEKSLETRIALIWKKGRHLSPITQEFINVCVSKAKK